MKICIAGAGYVGLSLAVLLSQKYEVFIFDIDKSKIDLIKKRISPIKDIEIEEYLKNKNLKLNATVKKEDAYGKADYVIIATSTNYDEKTGSFDTSSVETVICDSLKYNISSTIVIKSTIPFGFTDKMRIKHNIKSIFFSPEFLRESKALYDNLYPSRIIIGDNSKRAKKFGELLVECSLKNESEIPVLSMQSKEAEAVKLFANTFLAMRVSYFNELDSFSESQNLSSNKIIHAVCLDERIGDYYNNPSFGYGGYCLPKDTKQLLDNFGNVPNEIIRSVVQANLTRKEFIANSIIKKNPKTVGIYRLIMKDGSDNFRESAVIDIIRYLKNLNIELILYEPFIKEKDFEGIEVISNLGSFAERSDLIIANRLSDDLNPFKNKVYSRDIYKEN